jgi:type II secretory pathway component PulC
MRQVLPNLLTLLGMLTLVALLSCAGAPVHETPQPPGTSPALDPPPPERHARSSGARTTPVDDPNAPLFVPRAALDRVLAAGPGRLLQQVPIEPVFAPGHKFAGFRILSVFGDDPRVLRFGVLPGDVLLAVNGQRIVTPGDLMAAFQKLHGADHIEVSVLRSTTARTFRIPVLPASRPAAPPPAHADPADSDGHTP